MLIYYAGVDAGTDVFLTSCIRAGVPVLASFYYMKNSTKMASLKNYAAPFLLDSGGYTVRRLGVNIDVKEYAQFINKWEVKNIFNLDTLSVRESLENHEYLRRHTKARVVPVYHHSDYLKASARGLLDELIGQSEWIALGGVAGVKVMSLRVFTEFFDYVFGKVGTRIPIHGLGITNTRFLKEYPFYSVDSTTWLSGLRYGNFKVAGAVEDAWVPKMFSQMLRGKTASAKGWRQWSLDRSLKHFEEEREKVTKHWERKGVVWKDMG